MADETHEDADAEGSAPEPEFSVDMMALLAAMLNATGLMRVRRNKPRKRP